jgi:hypothetical protein
LDTRVYGEFPFSRFWDMDLALFKDDVIVRYMVIYNMI